MSEMEVSIKWKKRSGGPSPKGTNKRENTSAAFFGPMKFRSLRKYQIEPASTTQFKTPAASNLSGYKESHGNPAKGTQSKTQENCSHNPAECRGNISPRRASG